MITGQKEFKAYLKKAKKMQADMDARGLAVPTNLDELIAVANILELTADGMDILISLSEVQK